MPPAPAEESDSTHQLTQGDETLEQLIQHTSEQTDVSHVFISTELDLQFQQDRAAVTYDGFIMEGKEGGQRSIAFSRQNQGAFDVLVARNSSSDIVVPSGDDGKCGISRSAFRLWIGQLH